MDLSPLVLPTEFRNHFMRIEVLELCDISTKEHLLELHLEEKNNLPSGYPLLQNMNYKVICYYLSFE